MTVAAHQPRRVKPLTADESALLSQHEAVIERHLQSFVEVGLALWDIRKKKLYRAQYATFDTYMTQRWDLGSGRGYQLMAAATVVKQLSTMVDIHVLPTNERQARELVTVPPQQRREVWQTAVTNAAGGAVTAEHVKAAVCQQVAVQAMQEAQERAATDDAWDAYAAKDPEPYPYERRVTSGLGAVLCNDRLPKNLALEILQEWFDIMYTLIAKRPLERKLRAELLGSLVLVDAILAEAAEHYPQIKWLREQIRAERGALPSDPG